MSTSIGRRGAALLALAGGLLLLAVAGAPAASAGTLYACAKKNGSARIFTKKPKCKRGETKLLWNKEGPAGRNGANGANGTNGTNGANGTAGREGKEGKQGIPGVAPNVFVGDKELKSGFASLMSVTVPKGSAAGGQITFTVLATDGANQAVTETGTIYWDALTNVVTCKVDGTNNLHLGEVKAGCSPGFTSESAPSISIFDNPSFFTPAPVVVNHVWFTITNNSGDVLHLE